MPELEVYLVISLTICLTPENCMYPFYFTDCCELIIISNGL